MTDIKVFKNNGNIVCVECLGHTGYAEYGEDIVCASLSSIVQTAGLGILMVAKINANIEQDAEKGYFKIGLPNNISDDELLKSQIIFDTMMCGISELLQEYSDFINLEVIENV